MAKLGKKVGLLMEQDSSHVNKYIEYNQNDVDKIYNEEKKLIENKENDYEQLRKTQIQTGEDVNYNPLFAYIDENNSKNENDKNTIISTQNIEGDYSINPNPFLNIDNNYSFHNNLNNYLF